MLSNSLKWDDVKGKRIRAPALPFYEAIKIGGKSVSYLCAEQIKIKVSAAAFITHSLYKCSKYLTETIRKFALVCHGPERQPIMPNKKAKK